MEQQQIVQILKKHVALFNGFDDALITEIAAQSKLTSFEKNEAIIEFGRTVPFLGVLLNGTAQVSCVLNSGETQNIAQLHAPAIFGEMSFMTGERSVVDVIGLSHCDALLIPTAVCSTQIISAPSALQVLAKLLAERAVALESNEQLHQLQQSAETQTDDPYGFVLKSVRPQKCLVINCGSSSLKYQLFDTDTPSLKVSGLVEKIGAARSVHKITIDGNHSPNTATSELSCADHEIAFKWMNQALLEHGLLLSASDITAVGHRVVHGGETFSAATIIDGDVLKGIEALNPMAPLHNPINLVGIRAAMAVFPNATHVASFDTTFHHTLPPYAYLYGLPYGYYRDHGVRRYGFHGASHEYVSLKTAQFVNRPYNDVETIVCHLGNGSSICAIDHGRSVDTTMGFTPAAGLPMGTRVGDVDPGALCHIARLENWRPDDIDKLINTKSGLLGISERSSDMRELERRAEDGHRTSQLAIKTFCYQIRKTIGAYVAAMQGLDALVFTGGIGENSALVRSLACQGLECMGIAIDAEKNRAASGRINPMEINTAESSVRVLVIPTNEELMIARNTLGAIERARAVNPQQGEPMVVPIEVSAHHVHLCQKEVDALFGKGHTLTPLAALSQPGQYACKEQVDLVGPKGTVQRVRVLGPPRAQSQVEISMTEQFKLGIQPPIRQSGNVSGTPGVTLRGPAGKVHLKEGVICAMRHIHMTPKDALVCGVRDKYVVRVIVDGDRELIFGDVLVRVSPNYQLAMHIDTDEANAANLKTGIQGRIESIQSRP